MRTSGVLSNSFFATAKSFANVEKETTSFDELTASEP